MDFSPSLLHDVLRRLPVAGAYRIAFSGGCDSTVLLHAMGALRSRLAVPLSALHVDHGLHAASAEWSRKCEAACAGLGIPCTTLRVEARARPGESPEAAARNARYGAFARELAPGEALLTAHHRGDQAETLLLHLLRGAGTRGLAGMCESMPFAAGLLQRPLLSFSRAELCRYASAQELEWTDDPSNFDVSFDRNFLRHQVMPSLTERWPGAEAVIARAARFQGEATDLLNLLAEQDRESVCEPGNRDRLRVTALTALNPARRRNLLRYCLRQSGLPMPSSSTLERVLNEVLPAREDGAPCVAWPGAEARRYRDRLYLLPSLPPIPTGPRQAWNLATPLLLPQGLGRLKALPREDGGQGIKAGLQVEVGFRTGGEQCRPAGSRHHRSLKKLLQEAGVPPWERERLPLLFVEGKLAAVADLWVCDPFAAAPEESGMVLRWERFTGD